MTKTVLYLLLFITCGVYSQEMKKTETKKKNTISIEFYQPIQNSIREFYNDDWLLAPNLGPDNKYSRSSFSNAFGISYERVKNNAVFRVRLGLTIRDIKEHQDNRDVNEVDNYTFAENYDYTYKQNHINVFVGIARRVHLANNFDLDFGIDLASVYYLQGKGDYNYNTTFTSTIDNSLIEEQKITVDTRIGNIYSFGLGPVFKPQYNITKKLVVSAELQVYFMKTFTNDKSTRVEISDRNVPPQNFTEHIELHQELAYDVNQWNWTKASPLVRIGYQF